MEDKHEQSRIPVRQCANGEVFQRPEDIFLLKCVFCQALFPEKSVKIPCFHQGIFPAFGGR